MPLDKGVVIKRAKMALYGADKKNTTELELALASALDDLSMRLKSEAFITNYTETVPSGSRTHTLTGQFNELKRIFALKLGDGTEQRVLEYVNPQQFLREHDRPDAVVTPSVGNPNKYTILDSDDGHPIVKFNLPLAQAETITVYHYVELTVNNVAASRSAAALVAGTIAYFCGIKNPLLQNPDGTTKRPSGSSYYTEFKSLAALSRASDTFTPLETKEFELSKQDKRIRSTVKGRMRMRR